MVKDKSACLIVLVMFTWAMFVLIAAILQLYHNDFCQTSFCNLIRKI